MVKPQARWIEYKKEVSMGMEEERDGMARETEILRADIEKLRNDLGEMLGSVGSYSKEKIMGTGHRLQSVLEDIEGRAKSRFRDTTQMVKERGHQAVEKGRQGVGSRPLTAIAVAFVSGAALGLLCKRIHR